MIAIIHLGRFQPDTRLCLSMSDFHPSTWNPSWSVATILTGLLSFMVLYYYPFYSSSGIIAEILIYVDTNFGLILEI